MIKVIYVNHWFSGYVQTSGFNPESDIYMIMGYSHWVLFSVPSAYAIVVSVKHMQERPLPGTCPMDGTLKLFQEHRQTAINVTGLLDSEGGDSGCEIPLDWTATDSSVTQVTVNGSTVLADLHGLFDNSTFARTDVNAHCGRLEEVWTLCDSRLPDPYVSENDLRLHVISELNPRFPGQRVWEGFRLIFTFHKVRAICTQV